MNFNGANTYTGKTTLTAGKLNLGNASALGGNGTVALNGGTLVNTLGSAITSTGSGSIGGGSTFTFGSAGQTSASNVTLNGTTAFTSSLNETVTLAGASTTLTLASTWNNSSAAAKTLTVNGAGNTLSLGGLALDNTVGTTAYTQTITGSGTVVLAGAVVNGTSTGVQSLTYSGTGELDLNGTNTYGSSGTGATTIALGTVGLGNKAAFGTSAVTLKGGASVYASTPLTGANAIGNTTTINNAIFTGTNSIEFSGAVTDNGTTGTTGIINNISGGGTLTFSAAAGLTLGTGTTNTNLAFSGSGTTIVDGPLLPGAEPGPGLTYLGTGLLDLKATSTDFGYQYIGSNQTNTGTVRVDANNAMPGNELLLYNGTVDINTSFSQQFTLAVFMGGNPSNSGGVGSTSNITIESGGNLYLNGNVVYDQANTNGLVAVGLATISGAGTVDLAPSTWTTTGNRTFNVNASTGNSGGTDMLVSAVIANGNSHAQGLIKTGAGLLQLTNTNTYTGSTTVSVGTLQVDGSLNANSTVAVSSGATLSGIGTINGVVTLNSTGGALLAPGTVGTAGTLTMSSNLNLAGGSTLEIDLGTTQALSDQLVVSGSLTATGSGNVLVAFNNLGTLTAGKTYTLITGFSATTYTAANFAVTGAVDTGGVFTMPGGNVLDYTLAGGSATNGAYTLTTSVTGANLGNVHANGGTTTVASTIQNTGTSPQDTLDYSGLAASPSAGTVAGTAGSGSALALGATSTPATSQTFTSNATLGSVAISPTATVTNTTDIAETPVAGAPNTTSVNVYSGLAVWNTNGGGTWGTFASSFGTNWGTNQGSPGLDPGFVNTDTATFDNTALTPGTSATVNLDGATPSLNKITFNTAGVGYTLAQDIGSGSITLDGPPAQVTVQSGTDEISAPVVLATNATVTVDSVSGTPQQLTISGAVTGAFGLTNGPSGSDNGTGNTFVTSNGNTYSGGTTITGGKFYVNNNDSSKSGTGTDGVTVNSGGTLAGSGYIKPTTHTVATGVIVNAGGSLYSGGVQGAGPTVVSPGITLDNTAALSSILAVNGGNLTFALGTGGSTSPYGFNTPNTSSTYMTVVGNTPGEINFSAVSGAVSVTIQDMSTGGLTALRLNTPYLLIQAGSISDYYGLVTEANPSAALQLDGVGFVVGVWAGGANPLSDYTTINILQVGANGAPLIDGSTVYPDPVLYLNAAGDLLLVPEPGTWALMLSGMIFLIFVVRRHKKNLI